MDLGLKGPTFTIASACSSGTHAIGQAFQMVRTGQAPIALTGGTEACLTVGTFKGWEALRVLSSDTCRPFSRTRSGLVLGEGAAMFVLEPRDHAMARGAPIYAEMLGFGMSADAGDITAIDPERRRPRHARRRLKDAKVNPDDVDYVNAHGTGTALNDKGETVALRHGVRRRADQLAVSSSKARARPQPGRGRRARACRHGAGAASPDHSADGEFRRGRSGLRPRLCAEHRAQRADPERDVEFVRVRRLECGAGARARLSAGQPRAAALRQIRPKPAHQLDEIRESLWR